LRTIVLVGGKRYLLGGGHLTNESYSVEKCGKLHPIPYAVRLNNIESKAIHPCVQNKANVGRQAVDTLV
jgi:hypothetical protein